MHCRESHRIRSQQINEHYSHTIHKLSAYAHWLTVSDITDNLFMSGIRPIERIVRSVFCEQAPSHRTHNPFCMAELIHIITHTGTFSKGFHKILRE